MKDMFKLTDVTFAYPNGATVLSNITLSFPFHKKIVILGANGTGKSTLFLLLNGILKPTKGELFFSEEKITYKQSYLKQLRQEVGLMFQDPDMQIVGPTVIDDVAFGPMNLNISEDEVRSRVEKAMQMTEIDTLSNRAPYQLSLGQKKRVALAGILALEPKVIIMDEPTAGLDPYYEKQFIGIMDKLFQEGKTLIVATHDLNFAYCWADEIYILHEGKVATHGSPEAVFRNQQILKAAHLEKPLMLEVYDMIQRLNPSSNLPAPRSRKEMQKFIETAVGRE